MECFYNISVKFDDVRHSQKEPRKALLGSSHQGRLLAIVYTIRNEKVRIISTYQALIKIWLAEKLTQEKLLQSCLVFGKTRDARVLHVVCAPKKSIYL
ncbi:MAG: BrnT family toxin [Deltaproteobacteria bacterium]|nr:MAG: BrnT family toxin [Deltaproteobacteria bacterium]